MNSLSSQNQKNQVNECQRTVNQTQKTPDSPFLNTEEAAQFVRLAQKTLENRRSMGTGPPFRKHGNRVYYHIDELREWSAAHSKTCA